MLSELNGIEIAELILLIAGAVMLIASALAVTARRAWGRRLRLEQPPPNRLEPSDLLLGFIAVLLLPAVAVALSSEFDGADGSTQPPDDALPIAATAQLALAALGQAIGIVILLGIGRERFSGGLGGWGLSARSAMRRLGSAALVYVMIWPICFGLLHASVWSIRWVWPGFEPDEHSTIEMLMRAETPAASRWLLIVTAAVLAPFAEELFFRGILLPALAGRFRSTWAATMVTAIAFGAMHYAVPQTVPALIALGLALGYVYLRTRSLTLSILIHMVFNAKSILWLALGAAS